MAGGPLGSRAGELLTEIKEWLAASGHDLEALSARDLAPVDEVHLLGRDASVELAVWAQVSASDRVLDIGAGLGGSVRFLSTEVGCKAVGIEIDPVFVQVASELSDLVGQGNSVWFKKGSALRLPWPRASFDVVWTEHAQMTIADKATHYAEAARVLSPGGRLALHEIFAGPAGEPDFPLPWASRPEESHLIPDGEARDLVGSAGFEVSDWEDRREAALDWLHRIPMPPGARMVMGEAAETKRANLAAGLADGRLTVIQAVATLDTPE